jgi:hypothetical protein
VSPVAPRHILAQEATVALTELSLGAARLLVRVLLFGVLLMLVIALPADARAAGAAHPPAAPAPPPLPVSASPSPPLARSDQPVSTPEAACAVVGGSRTRRLIEVSFRTRTRGCRVETL